MEIDIGIGLVEQDAFAVSEVPEPAVALDAPIRGWLWRDKLLSFSGTTTSLTIATEVRLDLHGQRKLGTGELVMIWDSSQVSGTSHDTTLIGIIRTLWKMP